VVSARTEGECLAQLCRVNLAGRRQFIHPDGDLFHISVHHDLAGKGHGDKFILHLDPPAGVQQAGVTLAQSGLLFPLAGQRPPGTHTAPVPLGCAQDQVAESARVADWSQWLSVQAGDDGSHVHSLGKDGLDGLDAVERKRI